MTCDACRLELPDRIVFKCDRHCEKKLCVGCLRKHAVEVTMTHRLIPSMMKATK